jgi:hypothetical protein
MEPSEQLEKWLEHAAEKVQRNVEVVTPVDLEQDYLLHMSTNTSIRKFVPLIGRRQAVSEDRTVPRITVAPTILGCFIGYAQAHGDFQHLNADGTKEDEGYKGGWKIYSFPFEAALQPNTKLVYDAKSSGELWLTSYSPETVEYIPHTAGKMFFRSMRLIGRSGAKPYTEMELYIEVAKEGGLRFSKNHYLDKGYWKIEGPYQQHVASWTDDKHFHVTEITREEYLSAKVASADLLSLPAHQRW